MILCDMSQIIISMIMVQSKGKPNPDENLIRHMVINELRTLRNKFKESYGDLVLCYDSSNSWRKDIFPEYKAHRKIEKEKSDVDWDKLYTLLNQIGIEVQNNFPYKVLKIDRCEADDIIAVLSEYTSTTEKVLIVSSDKDFQQLQLNKNIEQYCPRLNTKIKCENPEQFLYEHILKGDTGDGIPNVLSDSDVFITEGKRQKSITKKKLEIWSCQLDKWNISKDSKVLENLNRNRNIIDFVYIPSDIRKSIINTYESIIPADKSKIMNYLIEKEMSLLITHISEF